jgi:hypothetical protein
LKMSLNGCSTTLTFKPGFASVTVLRALANDVPSPPPEPYECHRVMVPDRPPAAADGAAEAEAGAGVGLLPPHAAATIAATPTSDTTREWIFTGFYSSVCA